MNDTTDTRDPAMENGKEPQKPLTTTTTTKEGVKKKGKKKQQGVFAGKGNALYASHTGR